MIQVLILDVNELENEIASNPLAETEAEPNTLHFFFLSSLLENPDLQALESIKKDSEQFGLIDKVFYLYAPEGVALQRVVEDKQAASTLILS